MNINEKTIKERIVTLDKDIATMQMNISKIDNNRLEALAQLNALHGAKQQCESFLKDLNNDDQKQNVKSAVGQ
jgi:prefoldin subunit 5